MALTSPVQLNRTAMVFELSSGAAGVREEEFTIEGETILLSMEVEGVASGDVTLQAFTKGDPNSTPTEIVSFPVITGPTGQILLRKAAVSLSRVLIRLTTTGVSTLKVWVRPLSLGETTVRIQGAAGFTVTRSSVTVAQALVSASLEDRYSLCLKNLGPGILYIAEVLGKANSSDGYPLSVGESLAFDLTAGVSLFAGSSGTSDVALAEGAGA